MTNLQTQNSNNDEKIKAQLKWELNFFDLFWECSFIQYFWNKLFDFLIKHNFDVIKNKFDVFLYTRDRLLSYIYLFAKWYIYQCKFKNSICNIETFQIKLKNRKTLE